MSNEIATKTAGALALQMDEGELMQVLHYDPETGVFTRLRASSHAKPGPITAKPHKHNGYIEFWILGRLVKAHRLAFIFMTGSPPVGSVDHVDGDRANNRWANLRDVTNQVNCENRRSANANNKTGLLGVKHHKRTGRFEARIRSDGELKYIGIYDTAEAAHAAYLSTKRTTHKGCTI